MEFDKISIIFYLTTLVLQTIARTAGINRKTSLTMANYSSQMDALQEEEEEKRQAEVDIDSQQEKEPPPREVGIDCPPERMVSTSRN